MTDTKVRKRPQKQVIMATLVVFAIIVIWVVFVNSINSYSQSIENPIWSIVFNLGMAILLFVLPYLILKKGTGK